MKNKSKKVFYFEINSIFFLSFSQINSRFPKMTIEKNFKKFSRRCKGMSAKTFLLQWLYIFIHLYDKTTCKFQIKFGNDDYLQIYKTLQLFTSLFTLNTNIFTSIKVIKNTNVQTQKLFKMPTSVEFGLK